MNINKLILFYRIFFQGCDYKLRIGRSKETERVFFKSVRNIIYEIAMVIFKSSPNQWVYFKLFHRIVLFKYSFRVNLENNYQAIALTLVEMPYGYTASCYVTVAMSLQEYAFHVYKDNLVKSNHLHAIVVSMMTLVCYIHKAEVRMKIFLVSLMTK